MILGFVIRDLDIGVTRNWKFSTVKETKDCSHITSRLSDNRNMETPF